MENRVGEAVRVREYSSWSNRIRAYDGLCSYDIGGAVAEPGSAGLVFLRVGLKESPSVQ